MKKIRDFHFKEFSVAHQQSIHKVGTDGVLLGAWAPVSGVRNVLDVGTGTGIIALMIAQRTSDDVSIDAIEMLEASAGEALENFERSPWKNKLHVYHTSFQNYRPEKKYELIVSNPPFFVNSFLPPDAKRSQVRHTGDLDFRELLEGVRQLLQPAGTLSVILPYTEGKNFRKAATGFGLFCVRECSFRSRPEKPVERLLMSFGPAPAPCSYDQLTLYDDSGQVTAAYSNLTNAFYLDRK